MNIAKATVLNCVGCLCLCIALMPAISRAQAGQGGGGLGAGAMAQGPQQLKLVLSKLDLTEDQKAKIDAIIADTQKEVRAINQSLADATPEERQQKMADRLKILNDTKTKVEAELTPEQKAKYYPLVANLGLKSMGDMVTTMKAEAAKLDIGDDQKKQVASTLDDARKTLDGMKSDADAVKDADTAADFQKQIVKSQTEAMRQLVDIMGQEDMRTLMQNTRQAMMRNAVRNGAAGATGATAKDAPTTQPAAK